MKTSFLVGILGACALAIPPSQATPTPAMGCEKIPEAHGLTAMTWCEHQAGRFDHGNCLQMKHLDLGDPRARALNSYLSTLWDDGCESEAIGTKNSIGMPITASCTVEACQRSAKAYYREATPR